MSRPALTQIAKILDSFMHGSFLDDDGTPTVWSCDNCLNSAVTKDAIEHGRRCRIGKMLALVREGLSQG